ncbi:MAG TPA: VWA domain-containing protein [Thermodesulfobacteriota bacterium]
MSESTRSLSATRRRPDARLADGALGPLPEPGAAFKAATFGEALIGFARALETAGCVVEPPRVHDLARAVEHVSPMSRVDFYHASRATLISRKEDLDRFDAVFDLYWSTVKLPIEESDRPDGAPQAEPDVLGAPATGTPRVATAQAGVKEAQQDDAGIPGFSPDEALAQKDFLKIDESEMLEVRRLLQRLAERLATRLSRRRRPKPHGRYVDLRRTMRWTLQHGGEPAVLAYRARRVRKNELVLICDVSGSMDRYSRFLIEFVYGLQAIISGVETFVFSTRLTRITPQLRRRTVDEALVELSRTVADWSGGTNIGRCLQTFNDRFAPTVLTPRTVVLLLSDGWDKTEPAVLQREMRRIQQRSAAVIWLNPLQGNPAYESYCRALKEGLPFLHAFLPARNLESLAQLSRELVPLCQNL